MFTGIIEAIGTIKNLENAGGNVNIEVVSNLARMLKIDQSVAHNGVCLTVVEVKEDSYIVTAIAETLQKTNLGSLKQADPINLERAMKIGDRLDGHMVQGHVDQTGICKKIENQDGSWLFTIAYDSHKKPPLIEKGSITINGVSLTVVNVSAIDFSVAIIPYTFENTTFCSLKPGKLVNLEFDVIGKYVKYLMNGYH